jgi:molecular chaperone GrpE
MTNAKKMEDEYDIGPETGTEDDPSLDALADAPELDELEELRAERDAYRDRFMRALAEAENARKRSERDRREAEQYGGSRLARDLLPVYDNLSRALDAAGEEQRAHAAGLIEGVELTLRELQNVFEKHHVTLIEPKVGDRFDPQHHQAMFEAPVQGTKAGDIIQSRRRASCCMTGFSDLRRSASALRLHRHPPRGELSGAPAHFEHFRKRLTLLA